MLNAQPVYLNMSRLKEALTILKDTEYLKTITASKFAELFWPDSDMHRTVRNTGNGACAGKVAWLCAGSYMGKLRKKNLIANGKDFRGYYITFKGKEKLKEL